MPALNSVIDLLEGINKTGHIGDDREADKAYAAFLRWRQPPDFVACYAVRDEAGGIERVAFHPE